MVEMPPWRRADERCWHRTVPYYEQESMMRIYINELIRLWKTPGIIFTLVIACLVTFLALNYKATDYLYFVQPQDYKNAFAGLEGLSTKQAYSIYAEKEHDGMDFSSLAFLDKTVKDELKEQASYEEYLDGIIENAEIITSVSIFADPDTFAYRNAEKTAEVYKGLKGKIETVQGPSKGMELWSGNGVVGLIIMLVLLVMINELILKDRESGQLNLMFTMDKGRGRHGFIKIFVCFTSAFPVTFVILLTAFLTSAYIFGNGSIFRPVQSVVGLKGCTMETSVLGYMAVYYLMLVFAVASLSVIIFFIASLIRQTVMVYFAVAAVFGIEGALYYLIGGSSYLVFLKEFNLLTFINPSHCLEVYGNVSIFGYPVNKGLFVLISLSALLFLFVPLAVKAYSIQPTVTVRKTRFWEIRLKAFVPKTVSTLRHEVYKLLINGGTLWVILLFAIFQAVTYSPVREFFENENAIYFKRYALQFEGPVTKETMEAIEKERIRFSDIEAEYREALANSPKELYTEIQLQYQDRLKPREGFEMFAARVEQLKADGGYLVYDTGYKLLTFDRAAKRKELTLAIMAGIMLVLSLSYLFAGDDRLYIERITSVTAGGRKKLFLKKILIGSAIVFIIYCLNYLPYVLGILNVYGSGGLGFPAQSVGTLKGTVFESMGFSIGGSIACIMVLKYLAMTAGMMILSFISGRLRSISRTIVVGLVVLVGPFLVMYVMS